MYLPGARGAQEVVVYGDQSSMMITGADTDYQLASHVEDVDGLVEDMDSDLEGNAQDREGMIQVRSRLICKLDELGIEKLGHLQELDELRKRKDLLARSSCDTEKKLMDLDRSRAALTSKEHDLSLELEGKRNSLKAIAEMRIELSHRHKACVAEQRRVREEKLRVSAEIKKNSKLKVELQEEKKKLASAYNEIMKDQSAEMASKGADRLSLLCTQFREKESYIDMIKEELKALEEQESKSKVMSRLGTKSMSMRSLERYLFCPIYERIRAFSVDYKSYHNVF